MQVQEIMTKNPAHATPGTTVREIAQMMQREDTGVVPIVEEGGDRRLVGVVTDRDLAIRVVAEGRDANTRVSEIMSESRVATAKPNSTIEDVLDLMGREQVRRIPVVDDRGALLGIVSQADVARKATNDAKVERTIEQISQPSGKHAQ
jgi:CBS domain-containing protein